MLQVHLGIVTSTPVLEIVSASSRVSMGEGISGVSMGEGISGANDVEAEEGEGEGEGKRHASKKSVGASKIERCRFSCEVELVVGRRGAVAMVYQCLSVGLLLSTY